LRQDPVNIEVIFRIVYKQFATDKSEPYRDFNVEVALKSPQNVPVNNLSPSNATRTIKGGNGGLTRRVRSDQVVSGVPPNQARKKPPRTPKEPRIKELLQQALEWQELLDSGQVSSQAAIARLEGITRGRVTQIMALLNLSPNIQRHILNMPKTAKRLPITERALRQITLMESTKEQLNAFRELAGG